MFLIKIAKLCLSSEGFFLFVFGLHTAEMTVIFEGGQAKRPRHLKVE